MRQLLMLCVLFLACSRNSAGFDISKLGSLVDNLPKPTATLEKFDIKQISLRDITFTFDIGINNPYVIGLRLAGVDLDFSVEGNKIFHTTAAKGFTVKARGKAVTSFDVTITYASIIKLIQDYNRRDYLVCDTDVLIKIPIPETLQGLSSTIDFPFKLSKQIPAIKPKVSITGFNVAMPTVAEVQQSLADSAATAAKNLDANKVLNMFNTLVSGGTVKKPVIKPSDIDLKFKVGFDIVLQNETKAPLDFTSLQFNLWVNSDSLVKGNTSKIQKTGNTTILKVMNEFSSKSLTPDVLNAFKKGTGKFGLAGDTTIQLPKEVLDHPLKLEFKENGSFKLR
jgi:LEA14-like dessication related protein